MSSATTNASTSPTYRVSSPSATNTGQSGVIKPMYRSPGTSTALTTRRTPAIASPSETQHTASGHPLGATNNISR